MSSCRRKTVTGSVHAQRRLAGTGRYRAVGIAVLLTAVLATEHETTVLYSDSDSEITAEVPDLRVPVGPATRTV
ncbi:PIN domain-containing protein [Blastococcus saxobsidens DD2]|uniref:PIN domain-containing protein n=1 Tax=Blastococcus saxobsidens (strain DD2) TaxID=1146883 RepID=H6RJU6_BLASD|nr:PIN domain-containing protein [Blastococcus saxobsidens DD2]